MQGGPTVEEEKWLQGPSVCPEPRLTWGHQAQHGGVCGLPALAPRCTLADFCPSPPAPSSEQNSEDRPGSTHSII